MYHFKSTKQAIDEATPKAKAMIIGCISVLSDRLAVIIAAKMASTKC